MKRRTLMRKMGAAGVGAAVISGTAAAKSSSVADLGELDVSSVDGWVPLEELLEPDEVAALPAGVDASEQIGVAPAADRISVQDCCETCCRMEKFMKCDCACCVCDNDLCLA